MDVVPKPTGDHAAPVVLVVDDEFLGRVFVVDELSERGFEVIEAGCAELALLVMSGRRVDAVVTDRRMPGPLDGDALAREVTERYPDVPVIMMSAQWPSPEVAATVVEFFPKPVDATAIARLIDTLLAARQPGLFS